MISTLIFIIVFLVLLSFATRWLLRSRPTQVAKVVRMFVFAGGGLVLIGLALTGRLPWLFALIGGAMPFLQRLFGAYRAAQWFRRRTESGKQNNQNNTDQTSHVETKLVRMTLDHASGTLSGTVLQGQFKGRLFSALTNTELLQLLADARIDDADAIPLIETYLDRIHPHWREELGQESEANSSINSAAMTVAQAYEILGLESGADQDQIKDAHRRLMQKLHPDRGGSTYLAAQINKAKDILLK